MAQKSETHTTGKPQNPQFLKSMTEWQQETKEIRERDKHILDCENMWSDCSFLVGPTRTEFECHAVQLAKTSPVLAKILQDAKDDPWAILLPDISPSSFSALIRYAYLDEIADKKTRSALLEAAEKFQLPEVISAPYKRKQAALKRLMTPYKKNYEEEPMPKRSRRRIAEGKLYGPRTPTKSPEPPKPVLEWQQRLATALERDAYLLEHGALSDITFVVEDEELPCHRFMMARTSPVFAAMLYGTMASSGKKITLKDVSLDAMKNLMSYAYKDEVNLEDEDSAWDLLQEAKKFIFPDALMDICRANIQARSCVYGLWNCIDKADEYDEDGIAKFCWSLICANPKQYFQKQDFLSAPVSVLQKLLQREHMDCEELDLYRACVTWANHQIQAEGGIPRLTNRKKMMAPLMPFFRFLVMNSRELALGPADGKTVFDSRESLKLLRSVVLGKDRETPPKNVSVNTTPRRNTALIPYKIYGCPPKNMTSISAEGELKPTSIYEKMFVAEADLKIAKHDLEFIGVRLPSQIQPEGVDKEFYNEDLTVYVYEVHQGSPSELLSKTRHMGLSPYTTKVAPVKHTDVKFDNPYPLDAMVTVKKEQGRSKKADRTKRETRTVGGLFEVKVVVVFHKSGMYPKEESECERFDYESGVKCTNNFAAGRGIITNMFLYQNKDFKFITNLVFRVPNLNKETSLESLFPNLIYSKQKDATKYEKCRNLNTSRYMALYYDFLDVSSSDDWGTSSDEGVADDDSVIVSD